MIYKAYFLNYPRYGLIIGDLVCSFYSDIHHLTVFAGKSQIAISYSIRKCYSNIHLLLYTINYCENYQNVGLMINRMPCFAAVGR